MSLLPFKRPNSPGNGDPAKPHSIIIVNLIPDRFHDVEEGRPIGSRRINLKALVVLGLLVLLSPIIYMVVATNQDARLRRVALEQARTTAERGQVDQAVLGLTHYLKRWPDDIPGLELMARLRTEGARSLDQLILAADVHDHLLRVDPMAPGRQDNRRKLVELYIKWTEVVRLISTNRKLSVDRSESRARTAVKIAEQLIAFGADDAEAHRLLAMALESVAATGDSKALIEATVEYEKALRRDRGDVASAERLAQIVLERSRDNSGPDEIYDELLQARPESIEVRLARYRFFSRTGRLDRARAELDRAMKQSPTDPEVRLIAASEAIQARDPILARHHLDAIPAGTDPGRRGLLLRGFVDLIEQHSDVAVESWRNGLLSSGGSDRELTWRLAYTLVQLGRFAEAEPLVVQYRRLAGEDDPMLQFLKGVRDELAGRPAAAIAGLDKLKGSVAKAWHPDIAMTLARCYERINDDPRAILEYRQAIKASPRSAASWRAIARLIKKTNPDEAVVELEKGLEQLPGDPALVFDLAMARLEQQLARPKDLRDWSRVKEALDRAVVAGRPDPGLVKVRAEMLHASGRPEEALGLLEEAVSGEGRSRDDLWLCWAGGLAGRGQLEAALKVLERASSADQAGDRASLRIARANLLIQLGRGRAARDLLGRGADSLAVAERVALARARARTLQVLGDKAGARQACLEWARLSPVEADPGLELLEQARRDDDAEAAELGLKLLRDANAENEPPGLAARALDLLLSNRAMAETRTARVEVASELSHRLMTIAPRLPISRLVRGMILERNHRIGEAIVDYQAALEGKTAEMALSRLTLLYARLKRFDELAALKGKLNPALAIDQVAARMAIAQGDKDGAERLVTHLAEGQADDPSLSAAQAGLLREIGKPQEAEETLMALVDRVGKDRADAWVALATFQAGRGPGAASKTVERASAEYKGDRPDLLMARLRWIAGDREAAARLYDEAASAHPDDPATYQAASAFAEAVGRLDRAEALARRALKVPACSARAARTLAMLLSRRGDPPSWREAWALVGPGGPGGGEAPADRLLRACLLILSPDPARRPEAIADLKALIEDLPASSPVAIRARVNLASALRDAGQPAEAARSIAEATEDSAPSDPATLATAVELLARAGRPEQAEPRLARLDSLEPDSPRTTCARSWVLLARGKPEEAAQIIADAAAAAEKAADAPARQVAYYSQLLALNQPEAAGRLARKLAQSRPAMSWVLAEFLAGRGDLDEALDACRAAVEAGATAEPARLALGLVLNGRLSGPQGEKARAVAEAAAARQPKDADLLVMLGLLAIRQGRHDDALKAARRAVEANPANLAALNSLNDLAWIFSEELGRPADALPQIDRVLQLAPLPSAMDTRGVILTRLGRNDEAIAQLEHCVQLQAGGNRLLHLARAYQKANKLDSYKKALEGAKQAGIDPASLTPKEQAEFAAILGR